MKAYFFLLLILLSACISDVKKQSVYDSTTEAKDTIVLSKENIKESTCFGYITYDSCTEDFKSKYISTNPSFANMASFKFFFKNKKNWDANKPLVLKLGLPKSAVIIEKGRLKRVKNREIIIWMDNPNVVFSEETGACGERTTGVGQFAGEVKISLINNKEGTLLNTLSVPYYEGVKPDKCFQLPYLFYTGDDQCYTFLPSGYKEYSKVQLIKFEDHNDDGLANEFCFYSKPACSITKKTMFIYEVYADSIFNYPIISKTTSYDSLGKIDTIYSYTSTWIENGFLYPELDIDREFSLGEGYMPRGEGLPICKVFFDKKSKVIYSNRSWYDFKYVINNKEKFEKYFVNGE